MAMKIKEAIVDYASKLLFTLIRTVRELIEITAIWEISTTLIEVVVFIRYFLKLFLNVRFKMTLHRIDQGRICGLSKEVVQAHYQGQETYRSESYFYVFLDFD